MTPFQRIFVVVCAAAMATPASAAQILIVNGSSVTSEPGTTSSITSQLTTLHNNVGNSVQVSDLLPGDLSPYGQVWDLRFSNASPLSSSTITQLVNYLAGGGGVFVMGENSSFSTRNNSILSFIDAAGGGNLTFTTPGDSQVVNSPFNSPNVVNSLVYSAAGGVTTAGTGQFITSNNNGGTGVAFGVGTLANAQLGALTTIFDVNFLQTSAPAASQALAGNLVNFVGQQVGSPVPEPATWLTMILGFGVIGFGMRRKQRQTVRYSFA